MIYRELVAKNKLFRQFDKLVEFEEVTAAEVQQLKGLVLDVADKVEPFMDAIHLTFKQYTKHDLTHLLNIAKHIHDFLPRRDKKKAAVRLNAVELAYLWLAILLHDVGMFVSENEEEQTLLDSTEYKKHCGYHRERLNAADAAEKAGDKVKARAITSAVFAEFIRQRHAERVHAFIAKHLKDKLRFRETDLSRDVGFLCESHNWGVRQSRDSRKHEQCVLLMNAHDGVGRTPVNLRYLACCLRLGDILDFDRTRTPLSAFHSIHFTESISVDEWNKHLSIKHIHISEQRVEYIAECKTPADYMAVHQFLGWVDRELQDVARIVHEFPKELAERYQLNLAPIAYRHQVKMADPRYVAGGFRFQLEYEQIMKLLMDKSLYPDETMFLRELLQNALDACRYQEARAKEKKQINYIPRIQVWDGSELPHNPDKPDEGPRIEFRDNGVGMSLDQVENFFMRVGKSYYRSADFRAERERIEEQGIHLDACSRFGIGFLSCFLGGDRIVVETYQYGSRPLRITIEGPSKYFVIEQLPDADLVNFPAFSSPSDPEKDSPPNCSGTKITVYLRKNWRLNPSRDDGDVVFKTLNRYAVNQEFPIRVSGSKQETREIAKRRWDTGSPALNLRYGNRSDWAGVLTPSVFDLSDYHEHLRGRGTIWFLADRDGKPTLQHGELQVVGEQIRESNFISAVRRLIYSHEKRVVISAMEQLHKEPERRLEILSALDVQLGTSKSLIRGSDVSELVAGNLRWAIETIGEVSAGHAVRWPGIPEEVTKLWDGDLNALGAFWKSNGCGAARTDRDADIDSSYNLALFGIESPGGFQSWNPVRGDAERHNWLPAQRLHVTVDTYGTFSPEPAASRLYVPDERGHAVREAVTIAFVRHAKRLSVEHYGSQEWTNWYKDFLIGWGYTSTLLSPPKVREFVDQLEELESELEFQDIRNRLWAGAAAIHSTFGRMVLTGDPHGWYPRNITQSPTRDDIELAATRSGVAPDQIDATVESLSEYLGWDITKGLQDKAP